MNRLLFYIFAFGLLLCTSTSMEAHFAEPHFPPSYTFPTTKQSINISYFASINIALDAKYKTKVRLEEVFQLIGFSGNIIPTLEDKKKFSDITHVIIKNEGTGKNQFKTLIDKGEPVLISYKTKIPITVVAYSYDSIGIWVSDPHDGRRKRILWNDIFFDNGNVRYDSLYTLSVKPYKKWNKDSKEREARQDIWVDEIKL